MTITRIINGETIDFELNSQELYGAFCEQEHKWDVSNVRNYLRANTCYAPTEEQLDDIAYEARRQADKYDLDFEFAIDEALLKFDLAEQEAAS